MRKSKNAGDVGMSVEETNTEPEKDELLEDETGEQSFAVEGETSPIAYSTGKFAAYTVNLPTEQLAALQSIWLELKRMYGTHSPDKSGMIQQAISEWLKKWDGPDRQQQLRELLEIRQDTRRRQFKKP